MSSKIKSIVLLCLFSLCIAGKANAGLIVGDLYADDNGIQWEYVGNFDLTDGIDIFTGATATTYNGVEAALFHFNTLSSGEIALSTNKENDYSNIADFIVNHNAFYDTFNGGHLNIGIQENSESLTTDINGNTSYDLIGDRSAYVWDRAGSKGFYVNHVFKSVSVPEPSTLAIFTLALIGLASRHIKKK